MGVLNAHKSLYSFYLNVLYCFTYSDSVPLLRHMKLLLVWPLYSSRGEKKQLILRFKRKTPKSEKVFQMLPIAFHSNQHRRKKRHNPCSPTCQSSVHHFHSSSFEQTRVLQFPSFCIMGWGYRGCGGRCSATSSQPMKYVQFWGQWNILDPFR